MTDITREDGILIDRVSNGYLIRTPHGYARAEKPREFVIATSRKHLADLVQMWAEEVELREQKAE